MPLALEVGEAVGVSVRRSVAAEVVAFTRHLAAEVVGFTHHLPASIRAEELAASIRRLAASTDLLLMRARMRSILVMHRVFMAFLRMLCTHTDLPATGSLAM